MSCPDHPRTIDCCLWAGEHWQVGNYVAEENPDWIICLACLVCNKPTESLFSPLCPFHDALAVWGEWQKLPDGSSWRELLEVRPGVFVEDEDAEEDVCMRRPDGRPRCTRA